MTKRKQQAEIDRAGAHLASFDHRIVRHYFHTHERLCWYMPYSALWGQLAHAAGELDRAEANYAAAKAKGADYAALSVGELDSAEKRFAAELTEFCRMIVRGTLTYGLNPKIGRARQIEHLKKCVAASELTAKIVAAVPHSFSARQQQEAKHVVRFSKATLDQVERAWAAVEKKFLERESAA